jgi:hypothetical protein
MYNQSPSTSHETEDNITDQEPEIPKKPFDTRIQAHLKVLIKLRRQKEKTNHHITLLTEALNNQRPPRGLIPRINPRLPDTSATFTLAWEEILHATGIQLTQKLQEYWSERAITIQEETRKIDTSLKNIADKDQCLEVEGILEEISRATVMDLKRKRPQPQRRENQLTKKTSQVQFRPMSSPRPQGGSRDPQ